MILVCGIDALLVAAIDATARGVFVTSDEFSNCDRTFDEAVETYKA
jgi:hypothetical protein